MRIGTNLGRIFFGTILFLYEVVFAVLKVESAKAKILKTLRQYGNCPLSVFEIAARIKRNFFSTSFAVFQLIDEGKMLEHKQDGIDRFTITTKKGSP